MDDLKIALIGIGATGAIQAAALLKHHHVICVDPRPGLGQAIKEKGITVSGALNFHAPVNIFFTSIHDLKKNPPNLIFISTKTYHLPKVLEEITTIFTPGTKIISTHNGLGTEDLIAEKFGKDSVFRMSLNFGVSSKSPGHIEMAFFNRPNYLGSLTKENAMLGQKIAGLFTEGGLDTEFVDNIKLYIWKKMIHKCSLSSICAITDRTIKEIMDYPPAKEIALGCFNEAILVAKAMGYDIGENYLKDILDYLEKVGSHKDSMCYDFTNKLPTEIDFLGGKIVEYAHAKGIPVPFFTTMSNLVKIMQESYQ